MSPLDADEQQERASAELRQAQQLFAAVRALLAAASGSCVPGELTPHLARLAALVGEAPADHP